MWVKIKQYFRGSEKTEYVILNTNNIDGIRKSEDGYYEIFSSSTLTITDEENKRKISKLHI